MTPLVRTIFLLFTFSTFAGLLTSCATTERVSTVEIQKVQASVTPFSGQKVLVSIGKFENKSPFMRGIFSDGVDRLGNQAKTILAAHMNQSGRFSVLDRENMAAANQEAQIKGQQRNVKGADFLIVGDVTEFGRKEVGDHQLFGILGRGKEQIAYSKVTINVVNANTSEVIFSVQGAGEYGLSSREVVGFGSSSSYDSTLNGKVLDFAIKQAVDALSKAVDSGTLRN
jgi:curli biogenesis system outer membrane secretion channel CsgG